MASLEGTPKSKDDVSMLDDSGYDGVGSATKGGAAELFNVEHVKRLLDACSMSREDAFWVEIGNFMMTLVVVASVCYLLMMGDQGQGNADKLGGKRAAIQHYYDSVYGVEGVKEVY